MCKFFKGSSEQPARENARIMHGEPVLLNSNDESLERAHNSGDTGLAPATTISNRWPFGYLFPDLAQDGLKLLPEAPKTSKDLRELGKKEYMGEDSLSATGEPQPNVPVGVPIPTIFTFFGQFVDHDVTLTEEGPEVTDLSNPNLTPLPYSKVTETIRNARTPNLDLDSVYGSDPDEGAPLRDKDKLRLGKIDEGDRLPDDRKDRFQDLYRGSPDRVDRTAMIGDPRNDENLILAQLHVAFLRAHNELIDRKHSFDEAKQLLIQHYQWIVLNDYLPRVADRTIVEKVTKANAFFSAKSRKELFMPLEFSVAAYRFGHSKVREFYPFKLPGDVHTASLEDLFKFTRFSNNDGNRFRLQIPGFWVVEWKNFLNSVDKEFFSRPIDTLLAGSLLNLPMERGAELPDWKKNLAVRNLLRGYVLRIPTGQAVAEAMNKVDPSIVPLTRDEIARAVTDKQRPVMDAAGFLDCTPLWLYVLIEAKSCSEGHHLGPVGSTIVAETLIGILRYSDYSILSAPGWKPTLGLTPGKFDLEDLLELAGVYDPRG